MSTLMSENSIPTKKRALNEIVTLIDNLVLQYQRVFRSDENKITFLRKAINEPWSAHPTIKVDAGAVKWRTFTTDMHAALSLSHEVSEQSSIATNYAANDLLESLETFMARYGRSPKYGQGKSYEKPRSNYTNTDNQSKPRTAT